MGNVDSLRDKVPTDSDDREEDDSYAKTPWHMSLGIKHRKVSGVLWGVLWDFGQETRILDLAVIANRDEDLPTIVGTIGLLTIGIVLKPRVYIRH